jgi:hypothetical protein
MNGALIEINLIDQAMLNVDSPRVEPGKIAYQLLVMRWTQKRVFRQQVQKLLRLWFESSLCQSADILGGLPAQNYCSSHQSKSSRRTPSPKGSWAARCRLSTNPGVWLR